MECSKLIEDDKVYNPEHDVWEDKLGQAFVKNEFDPDNPIWINVTGDYWAVTTDNHYWIRWSYLNLPPLIEDPLKRYLKAKLKINSVKFINGSRHALLDFSQFLSPEEKQFSDLSAIALTRIWVEINPHYASWIREAYSWLVNNGEDGVNFSVLAKLKNMKARNEVRLLKDVLNWHPTKGALTQEEEILLLTAIENPRKENTKEFGIRLFCWLLFSTLKRGKQIREMKRNCLKIVENKGKQEYFVLIKPVKAQTGDPEAWWPITKELFLEMERFSSIASINCLQRRYDRFWVIDCLSLHQYTVVSPADAKQFLQEYVKNSLNLISPRTDEPLHITPTRIRHTGATRLAYSGVPAEIISEILEHDDPSSCKAYIDAVGSELCPSIDRADRNMGGLFMQLNNAYFQGLIVDELTDQPIVLPDFSDNTPLFVGSCGRNTCVDGQCETHPFVSCYNGCPSFLAWKEADHNKALAYAEKEIERWSNASGHAAQLSTIKEFEELRENILNVIDKIKLIKADTDECCS